MLCCHCLKFIICEQETSHFNFVPHKLMSPVLLSNPSTVVLCCCTDSRNSFGMRVRARRCSLIWGHDLWSSTFLETTYDPSVNPESLGLTVSSLLFLVFWVLEEQSFSLHLVNIWSQLLWVSISYLSNWRNNETYLLRSHIDKEREREISQCVFLVFSLNTIPNANIMYSLLAVMLSFPFHMKIQNLYFKQNKVLFHPVKLLRIWLTYSHPVLPPGEYLNDKRN